MESAAFAGAGANVGAALHTSTLFGFSSITFIARKD